MLTHAHCSICFRRVQSIALTAHMHICPERTMLQELQQLATAAADATEQLLESAVSLPTGTKQLISSTSFHPPKPQPPPSAALSLTHVTTTDRLVRPPIPGTSLTLPAASPVLTRPNLMPTDVTEHTLGECPVRQHHWQFVKKQLQKFNASLLLPRTAVTLIENAALLQRYSAFHAQQRALGHTCVERWAWHGTSRRCIDCISHEGWKIGGIDVPSRGSRYGTGIYLSKDPYMALQYAPDGYILLCKVCCTAASMQYGGDVIHRPDQINVMVCKHKEAVLPAYVVSLASNRFR